MLTAHNLAVARPSKFPDSNGKASSRARWAHPAVSSTDGSEHGQSPSHDTSTAVFAYFILDDENQRRATNIQYYAYQYRLSTEVPGKE